MPRHSRQQFLRLKQLERQNRRLTRELRDAQASRVSLLEHLPVHTIQKDLNGTFTFASTSFCNLLQLPLERVIGKSDFDLFPMELASKFVADDRRVIQEGLVFDDIERNEFSDGLVTYMHVRKAPLRDRQDNIVGVQVMFWDVTKEYLGRQQLQRVETLAHALITAALDAVLLVDTDGRVVDLNPAAEKILGYSRDQVAGHPPLDSILLTAISEAGQRFSEPLDHIRVFDRQASISRIMQAATGTRIEAKVRHSDQRWFDAEISAHPLVIQGTSQGWALFVRDITKRKQREAELLRAKEVAEHASVAKSEFVANVSHELRTPLTGIIGLHELLQLSDISPSQQNYLQLAQTSANNLLRLIDDLLDFSKIEAGKLQLELAPFDLLDCVEQALNALAARAQLRGLELTLDYDDSLPARVIGDGYRVRQILLNLIGNAIKFTERGEICLRVTAANSARGTGTISADASPTMSCVRFEVHDTGIGVPVGKRHLIFEAFRQADTSMTRRYGGTGLGLAICRDLVKKMDGEIGIQDSVLIQNSTHQGCCFFFQIPLSVDVAMIEQTNLPARLEVVIVATPSLWRSLLEKQLQSLGYTIVVLTLDQLQRRQPARLFSAGNHTVVMIDSRELPAWESSTPPVVVRWILITPLAQAQQMAIPKWLSHADVVWLNRPVRRSDLLESLSLSAVQSSSHSQPNPLWNSRPAEVLLVEDSPVNQIVLRDMLEQLGHQVTLASDGRQAVQLCQDRSFDLVLMDLQMPEMNGLQAAKLIRQQDGKKQQTIYALSAHATLEDRRECEAAGMNGFLEKPITMELLSGALRAAMERENGQFMSSFVDTHPSDSVSHRFDQDELDRLAQAANLVHAPGRNELLAKFNSNARLLDDVLRLMVQEITKLSRAFALAVDQDKAAEARRAIHTFKSNCRQLGLVSIAEFSEQLERLSKQGSVSPLRPFVTRVQQLAANVADWSESMIENRS